MGNSTLQGLVNAVGMSMIEKDFLEGSLKLETQLLVFDLSYSPSLIIVLLSKQVVIYCGW